MLYWSNKPNKPNMANVLLRLMGLIGLMYYKVDGSDIANMGYTL